MRRWRTSASAAVSLWTVSGVLPVSMVCTMSLAETWIALEALQMQTSLVLPAAFTLQTHLQWSRKLGAAAGLSAIGTLAPPASALLGYSLLYMSRLPSWNALDRTHRSVLLLGSASSVSSLGLAMFGLF